MNGKWSRIVREYTLYGLVFCSAMVVFGVVYLLDKLLGWGIFID